MEKINIMMILLQKGNDVDIRLIYRCLNISGIFTKMISLQIVKMLNDFEKKEMSKDFWHELYT